MPNSVSKDLCFKLAPIYCDFRLILIPGQVALVDRASTSDASKFDQFDPRSIFKYGFYTPIPSGFLEHLEEAKLKLTDKNSQIIIIIIIYRLLGHH